jgi:hypothetical protein
MWILILVCLLDAGIGYWDAHVSGRYWSERDNLPGMVRFMMWCGAIMSVIAFSCAYIVVVTLGMQALGMFPILALLLFKATISSAEVNTIIGGVFDLWYITIIFPCLGIGLALWANSIAVAIKKHDLGSIAVAGWNTFAQGYNTVNAFRNVPVVLKSLGGVFRKFKAKDYLVILMFLPLVLSIGLAVVSTMVVMRASDAKYQLDDVARQQLAK